jgi:hypothetical protein
MGPFHAQVLQILEPVGYFPGKLKRKDSRKEEDSYFLSQIT